MYVVGQKVRMAAVFKVGVNPTDPTTVVFKLINPSGAITTYTYGVDGELVKDGVGEYHVDWLIALQGAHTYRFTGTGTCPAANEAVFESAYSPF